MMSFYSNGETQPNHNDSMTQEVTVQTISPGAEVSGGGIFINLVPKEGGNSLSGSSFFGYTGSGFQGSNLSDSLRGQGLTSGDGVDLIYDANVSMGGADPEGQAVVLRLISQHRQRQHRRQQLLPGRQ